MNGLMKGMESSMMVSIMSQFKIVFDRLDRIEGKTVSTAATGAPTPATAYSEEALSAWLSPEDFMSRLDDFAQRGDLSLLRDIR
jgi:hypothetical protein